MEPDRIWHVVTNPAWRPITDDDTAGLRPAPRRSPPCSSASRSGPTPAPPPARPKRIGVLIALRLLALLLAVLLALRPSAAITEIPKLPSTLIIVVDASESMTRQGRGQLHPLGGRPEGASRSAARSSTRCARTSRRPSTSTTSPRTSIPDRDKLTDEVKPDGKRTDFGTMLSKLYDRHQGERLLRGLIIVSDGADNGTAKPALPEATRWRGIGCPVYYFAVGGPTVDRSEGHLVHVDQPRSVAGRDQVRPQGEGQAQRPGLRGRSRSGSASRSKGAARQGRDFELAEDDGQRDRDRDQGPGQARRSAGHDGAGRPAAETR